MQPQVEQGPEHHLHAPFELTEAPLQRLGEGVGKVVYASEHWVVKRERSPHEVVALILLWHALRKIQRLLPRSWRTRFFQGPSRQIRALRVLVQGAMMVLPRSIWYTQHVREVWWKYHKRGLRGQRLADEHLAGTKLVPKQITFPPTKVKIRGWPGWLLVTQATERVDGTLYDRLLRLAQSKRFAEVERLLERFLETRRSGWQHGLFSVDAHLKNFGVCGDRVVLLDTGGLTNRWHEIEDRLAFEEVVSQPHIQLGLGPVLAECPDLAERFDARWRALVNAEQVRQHWQASAR